MLAGDISFADPVNYAAGGLPAMPTAADVNGDDVLDLVVGNYTCCGQLSLLLGNGDGTFGSRQVLSTRHGGSAHYLADFDNDGDLDIAYPTFTNRQVEVILNEGIREQQWAGFGEVRRFFIAGSNVPQGITAADFDGDTNIDVAIVDNRSVWVLSNQGVSDGRWQGFGEPVAYSGGTFPSSVIHAYLDDDSDLDLVVGNYIGGDVSVLLGNGDGTFEAPNNFPVGHRTVSPVLADLDSDGVLDVAAAVWNTNDVAVLIGNGDGTLREPVHYPVSYFPQSVTVADLDVDGRVDLAVTSSDSGSVDLLINNGDGTFFEYERNLAAESESGITAADLDRDGDMDLVTAGGRGGGTNVFLNIAGEVREAVWDGDAQIGEVGDGTTWGDRNNWSVDGVHDEPPAATTPGDNVTFPAGLADTVIELTQDQTVRSVAFQANVSLVGGTLAVTSGEVTVSSNVTATVHYGNGSLIKKGDGTLIVDGAVAKATIEAGTLRGNGTFDEVFVRANGTFSPAVTTGTVTVKRDMTVEGTLLIDLGIGAADVLDSRVVTLEPGSTLQLHAVGSLGPSGDKMHNVMEAARIVGTFTYEPAADEHIGGGVFTKNADGNGSSVIYAPKNISISVYQAAAGDVNGDGRFDQQDIVRVLQAGRYLTGQSSDWTQGDFNGDQLFDQTDIVAALQTGNYLDHP